MDILLESLKYIIIGLVQGLTEPIPVSSSGHVVIFSHILGFSDSGFFFALLTNTASLLAILFFYRKDLLTLTQQSSRYVTQKRPEDRNSFLFVLWVIIGTIPAGVLGILFKDALETEVTLTVIASTLTVTGIALMIISRQKGQRTTDSMTIKDAITIGLAQAVALVPGISRSGATVVAGLARQLSPAAALKYSFMLYIPVSLGGLILGAKELSEMTLSTEQILYYVLTFVVTMFTTYYALQWFMGIMQKGKLMYFAYYCFVVAILLGAWELWM